MASLYGVKIVPIFGKVCVVRTNPLFSLENVMEETIVEKDHNEPKQSVCFITK